MEKPKGADTATRVRSDQDFEANPAVVKRAFQEAQRGEDEARVAVWVPLPPLNLEYWDQQEKQLEPMVCYQILSRGGRKEAKHAQAARQRGGREPSACAACA
ncbi:unnamed protein product [Prorocentrum cordatum]|uniref:Uncharacterized protein n=1 Tax=Prorocentrum cordatum TaxID=2364126 RepID=A0ABN9UBU1_9DINO|nr:unnamed protein product [Polarella glacialis]